MKHLIIVGAQRCGSTLLYKMLDQHPEVMMSKPMRPEPKYFLEERDYSNRLEVYSEYIQKYYANPNQETKYFGEKSTSYLESSVAATRICQILPEVRILCILRDPVLRAISNYNFSFTNGLEKEDFQHAVSRSASDINRMLNPMISVNPYNYIQRGFYVRYLRQYLKIIDRSQMKIILLESLVRHSELITDIYGWLGLGAKDIEYSLNQKVNASTIHTHVDAHLLESIGNTYIESIRDLAHEFNIDTSLWESNPWYSNI